MYCPYCDVSMLATCVSGGNGWRCSNCGHEEPDTVACPDWAGCSCNVCKTAKPVLMYVYAFTVDRATGKPFNPDNAMVGSIVVKTVAQQTRLAEAEVHKLCTKYKIPNGASIKWGLSRYKNPVVANLRLRAYTFDRDLQKEGH